MVDRRSHAARSIPLQHTFSTPLGLMLWTALAAHWSFCTSLIKGGVSSYDGLMPIWIKLIALLAVWEPLSRYSEVFLQFHKSLSHLLTHGSLITTNICFEPAEHESEELARKHSKKIACKHEFAVLAREEIAQLKQQGYVLVTRTVRLNGYSRWDGWGDMDVLSPLRSGKSALTPPPPT